LYGDVILKKLLLLLMLSLVSVDSFATVIEFDTPPFGLTGSRSQTYYTESGVEFRGMRPYTYSPIAPFSYTGAQNPGRASNDSVGFIQASHLLIDMVDGSLFSLGSVSLAEYSVVVPSSRSFIFTGFYADGSTTSQTFVTDGLIDSIGGIDDFETFTFASTFKDLSYVTLTSPSLYKVSIDDLVVNPTSLSEPSTLSLLLLGSLGFAAARRKRASNA
jgi:hypothetical protein